ncbi:uncharacterized protein SPPG_05022 [Spizellomyces punctatus DAOM BR117]|uniref:BHLH domain-containing protein n=1 Tax=Spizellomyces punctatus (strain DAOM BR117) TaxID=645134 RepID=A0A0L0HFF8_SPIPD|nr:uncharacterized protein SPPG_05022 [Spizellomyces punctatus DAOM BR117]KNC99639.1 hypothetical protein SPPG_05022 [Spizellomyces punctatus DAOM BR117]|eukprot:XP_016607679.1 hypothetical protein SPPG_05022 [Spizellomyces punctatus DAOM BR117]
MVDPYFPPPPIPRPSAAPPADGPVPSPSQHSCAHMYTFQIPTYYPGHHRPPADYSTAHPLYRTINMAEKRAYHNATERARRENLNSRFQELAQSLPSLANVRKPSKSVIVNHSLSFVQDVKRRLEIKDRALETLRNRNEGLRNEVNRLRSLLGIPSSADPLEELDEDLQDKETSASVSTNIVLPGDTLPKPNNQTKIKPITIKTDTFEHESDNDEPPSGTDTLDMEIPSPTDTSLPYPPPSLLVPDLYPTYPQRPIDPLIIQEEYTTRETPTPPNGTPILGTQHQEYTELPFPSIQKWENEHNGAFAMRRAYSFDAAYLPGMQAVMGSMATQERF